MRNSRMMLAFATMVVAGGGWGSQVRAEPPAVIDLNQAPALAPESFHPAAGKGLKLGLADFKATLTPLNWPAGETRRFVQRGDGTQENRDTLPAEKSDAHLTTTPPLQAGTTLLGVDLATRIGAVDAEKFREFLKEKTSADASKLPADAQSVQVRLHASCKAIVHTPDSRSGSAGVCEKAGLRGEITPLADPSVFQIGGDLPLKVALEGSGGKNVRVVMTRPGGEAKTLVTDQNNAINVTIDKPGVWSFQFQHARPAPPESGADWDVFVSTLRFEVPPQEAGK